MKKILVALLSVVCILAMVGCGKKGAALSEDTMSAIENLNSIQTNYAGGVAPLIEIPPVWAEELYNNWDSIIDSKIEGAPTQLREYAATNVVYFDYADDFSVVWDKNNGSVSVEPTDVAERDAFQEKSHK